jgi:hypothetical protein
MMPFVRGGDISLERVTAGLPTGPLLERILADPELWKKNTWRQNEAGGQQDTESIMIRWAAENNFSSIRDSVSVVNTDALEELKKEVMPLIIDVAATIDIRSLGRIFIVKLKPGGRVYPHADVGLYADTFERFHICLTAPEKFRYYVQHPTGPISETGMTAGELWWFNHKRVHWAWNGSDTEDRISIVFDCVAPKFRKERDIIAMGIGYVEGKNHATEPV